MQKKPIRKLSSIEAHMAYMHETCHGNTQVSTIVTLRANLPEKIILDAIEAVSLLHPMLSVCIDSHNDELYFYSAPFSPDLNVQFIYSQEKSSTEFLLKNELNTVINPALSLWRITIVKNKTDFETNILFTRHHAGFDAYSANVILSQLLNIIIENKSKVDLNNKTVFNEFPHSTDFYLQKTASQATQKNHHQTENKFPFLPFYNQEALENRETGLFIGQIDLNISKKIQIFCKESAITVNSFFAGLFCQSFCQATNRGGIRAFTAVSLRDKLKAAHFINDIACFISVENFDVPYSEDGFLESMKNYQQYLLNKIDTITEKEINVKHSNIKLNMLKISQETSFSGIGITNLGKITLPDFSSSNMIIEQYRTAVSRVGGNLGAALHLSMFNEQFDFTITYPVPLMDNNVINNTVIHFYSYLEQI